MQFFFAKRQMKKFKKCKDKKCKLHRFVDLLGSSSSFLTGPTEPELLAFLVKLRFLFKNMQ